MIWLSEMHPYFSSWSEFVSDTWSVFLCWRVLTVRGFVSQHGWITEWCNDIWVCTVFRWRVKWTRHPINHNVVCVPGAQNQSVSVPSGWRARWPQWMSPAGRCGLSAPCTSGSSAEPRPDSAQTLEPEPPRHEPSAAHTRAHTHTHTHTHTTLRCSNSHTDITQQEDPLTWCLLLCRGTFRLL